MSEISANRFWHSRARRMQVFINLHWFLDAFFPASFAFFIVYSIVILAWKAGAVPATEFWLEMSSGIVFCGIIVGCLFKQRKHFHSLDDTFCRLEFELGLNNALTLARDGIAPFPPPDTRKLKLFAGHYRRRGIPALTALLLCTLLAIAVPTRVPAQVRPPQQNLPAQFEALAETLEELSEADIFDEEKLDAYQAELDALRSKDSEEWFSAASLEAATAMEEMLAAGTAEIAAAASQISESLDSQSNEKGVPAESASGNPLADPTLADALEALAQSGTLSLDPKMLAQLQAAKAAQNLSATEMKKLSESLKKAAEACQKCNGGQCNNPGGNGQKKLSPNPTAGTEGQRLEFSQCEGGAQPEQQGNGIGTKGGDHDPLSYGEKSNAKTEGESVNLNSTDDSVTLGEGFTTRAKPGKSPAAGKTSAGTQSGGNTPEQNRANAGAWSRKLTPKEREILKNAKE